MARGREELTRLAGPRHPFASIAQAQDNAQVLFDFSKLPISQDRQRLTDEPPIIDGPCLIHHDLRVGFELVSRRDPKPQRRRVSDQLCCERNDRCAWMIRLVK